METNYKKIVVAVDGSDAAEKALRRSIEVAIRNDAELVIAHVIDTHSYATIDLYDESVYHKAKEDAQKLLDDYKEIALEANHTKTKTLLDYGAPKTVIPKEIIPKEQADLLMIAETGLNAVERFIIGSVSERSVRDAPCDVLVVK